MSAQAIVGLALLFGPLLLVLPNNHRRRFVTAMLNIVLFQLAIALITQAFGIFTYPVVLTANLIVIAAAIIRHRHELPLIIENLKKAAGNIPQALRRLDLIALAVIVIAALHLGSVHYRYNGLISSATEPGYQKVTNYQYPYPYYADEWYAITFIKHSIATHELPVGNPLTAPIQPFPNFEAATHSLLAGIVGGGR